MDIAENVDCGIGTQAKAQLIGTWIGSGALNNLRGRLLCRGSIRVAECDYDVMAHGELALELAKLPAKRMVRVEGDIVLHKYQTGENKHRSIIEIEATSVTLCKALPTSSPT